MTTSVVLLSGGIDSAVALAMELDGGREAEALTLDYRMRHHREVDAAMNIARHYNVRQTIVGISPSVFTGSALTDDTVAMPNQIATEPDATYVPARNTVLLSIAAAYAESIGATRIVLGANADDAAGYPDCRREYIESFRDVLQLGTRGHVWVSAPLLSYTKSEVVDTARLLCVPINLTWSCYETLAAGPCGSCGACLLREQATA